MGANSNMATLEILERKYKTKSNIMSVLKINDTVNWKGGFGSERAKKARVEGIQITNGGKYGDDVDKVDWSKVTDRNVVVDLDNGHWAYAEQISKI